MESIDQFLCGFFYDVMKKHLTDFLNIGKVRSIKKALPEIRKKYKGERTKESLVHSFPAQKPISSGQENAYFYECSTLLASSTAKNFLEFSKDNSSYFKKTLSRKTVNICCLAGGIASDVVAIVKVLCSQLENCQHFCLTFVSANDKSNTVTTSVLKELQAHTSQEHRLQLSWEFVIAPSKADHSKQEVLEAFQTTDILIATKFSQELTDMKDKELKNLLEVAFCQMKSNSLFFFIDTSSADFTKHLDKELSKKEMFKNIFKKTHDCHTLSLTSIENHLKLYSDHFGVDLNSSYYLLSASAWLKSDCKRYPKRKQTVPLLKMKPYEIKKEKKEARKDTYWFRRSVENLCSQKK